METGLERQTAGPSPSHASQSNLETAQEYLQKMISYASQEGGINNEEAISTTKRQVEQLAMKSSLTRTHTKEARIHNDQGLEDLQYGQFAEAVRAFQEAVAVDPGDVEALNNLGPYRTVRDVKLLQEPRDNAALVTELRKGVKVSVVGIVENKWLRVESKRADRPPGYLRIEDAIREEQAEATQ